MSFSLFSKKGEIQTKLTVEDSTDNIYVVFV